MKPFPILFEISLIHSIDISISRFAWISHWTISSRCTWRSICNSCKFPQCCESRSIKYTSRGIDFYNFLEFLYMCFCWIYEEPTKFFIHLIVRYLTDCLIYSTLVCCDEFLICIKRSFSNSFDWLQGIFDFFHDLCRKCIFGFEWTEMLLLERDTTEYQWFGIRNCAVSESYFSVQRCFVFLDS